MVEIWGGKKNKTKKRKHTIEFFNVKENKTLQHKFILKIHLNMMEFLKERLKHKRINLGLSSTYVTGRKIRGCGFRYHISGLVFV